MTPHDDTTGGSVKPFLEHLTDLRAMLIRCAVALGVGVMAAIPAAPQVYRLLKVPLARAGFDPAVHLQVLEVTGGFQLAARIVLWTGLLLSAPFITGAVAAFVFPGLHRKEKHLVQRLGLLAVTLFGFGVWLCYRFVLPEGIRMLYAINSWMGVESQFFLADDYVSFVLRLLLAFGLAFELPVGLLALGQMGLVNAEQLRRKRGVVIVGCFVAAMFLTPPDPYTQIAMALPLCILYEACIWILWATERTRPGVHPPS